MLIDVYWYKSWECIQLSESSVYSDFRFEKCVSRTANFDKKDLVLVDGAPINLYQKPCIDGEVYWNRKSRYAVNLHLVCNDGRNII